MAIAPTAAVVYASVLSPLIAGDDVGRIKYLNIVYAIPSILGLVCGLVFCRT